MQSLVLNPVGSYWKDPDPKSLDPAWIRIRPDPKILDPVHPYLLPICEPVNGPADWH